MLRFWMRGDTCVTLAPRIPSWKSTERCASGCISAAILFAVLLITSCVLIRVSIPADLAEEGVWLEEGATTVALAHSLMPIAGIVFLWFIGVVRDRMGQLEGRFFSSVFMISLATISVRTRILHRGLAFWTYALALFLLLSIGLSLWVTLIFPMWVLTVSIYILVLDLRRQPAGAGDGLSIMME
jgi:hypothetical protein